MSLLRITLADGRTYTHPLGSRAEVIGRDINCDIPLDDPSASRRHARFSPTPDGWAVEDLGSKNGTLVNDIPCPSKTLRPGDRIQIGSSAVIFDAKESTSTGGVIIADEPASHATRYISRQQDLTLSHRRLEMIYELSNRLTRLQSQESLLETGMNICFETLGFERGAIGIRRRNSRVLDWPVIRGLTGTEGELTISRTLLTRALEHGERAMFTEESGQADPTVSMVQHGIRCAMCVPMQNNDEILGIVYGDSRTTSRRYTEEDIDFLAAIAQQLAIGLINCRLLDDQKAMIRINHDMELARRIQTGLFPADLPAATGLKIAAINDPGQHVSGDYYDVIKRDDGRIWCLIADVTGEGVAAALLMANLQAAVRVTAVESDDPAELLAKWNRLVCRNTDPATFITCLLTLIEPRSHRVCFSSAGHHLPLIIRGASDTVEELEIDSGFPLGVVDDATFPSACVDFGREAFLYFAYTDGVIEAMNDQQEQYGKDRLVSALTGVRALNPQAMVRRLRKDITAFVRGAPQSDDITMLAARIG